MDKKWEYINIRDVSYLDITNSIFECLDKLGYFDKWLAEGVKTFRITKLRFNPTIYIVGHPYLTVKELEVKLRYDDKVILKTIDLDDVFSFDNYVDILAKSINIDDDIVIALHEESSDNFNFDGLEFKSNPL